MSIKLHFAEGVKVWRKKCKIESDSFITGYEDCERQYYQHEADPENFPSLYYRFTDEEYCRGFDEAWYDLTQK